MTQTDTLIQNLNLFRNERITIIFDFDFTLVETDEKNDKESLYLEITVERFIEKSFEIFNLIKNCGFKFLHLHIVTARHSITIPKIAKILDFPKKNIIARNYCLSKEEMEIALSTLENEQKFVDRSIDWKVDIYNNFANDSRVVIVFDDHAGFINQKSRLAPNVIVLEPIY